LRIVKIYGVTRLTISQNGKTALLIRGNEDF